MLRQSIHNTLLVALMLTSVTLFASSAFAQSQSDQPSVSGVTASKPEPRAVNEVAAKVSSPDYLKSEIENLKAENFVVRELLLRMEEQQRALLEQVDRLQQRLDGVATAAVQPGAQPQLTDVPGPTEEQQRAATLEQVDRLQQPHDSVAVAAVQPARQPQVTDVPGPSTPDANASGQAANAGSASAQQALVDEPAREDHYQDGILIYQNPETAKVPFMLRFNNNTQVRYLNTLDSESTFTDHLGVEREVHERNDITVNRSMFIFAGYMFNPKLQYSLTVWTSAGAASIVVAGNIGWRFNKALTVTGGYTGVPGSRSLVNTFPFFQPTDRSMADNFFRPGFTQGMWANGDLGKGVNYLAFVGNGLNTLSISAAKIDTNLLLAGSVWWEPLGPYSEPGKSRNMYDDYFASKNARVRIGTSFTRSREDRFSALDQSNPDNTSIYNSDGVLAFSTGAFAPGVTVDEATYRMWAIDGGFKKSGFSVNGQYYYRWVYDFLADGPLPLTSTFDHGFEVSASHFIVPKKLAFYARASKVFGEFRNPYEYAGGFKWYFLPTERLWLTGELMRVHKAPYSGAFTPYTAGLDGWAPMVQTVLAF